MPGLVGYTDRLKKHDSSMLSNMRNLLKYFDWYIDAELYSDGIVNATQTHLGIINKTIAPHHMSNRFSIWIEGEFYNQEKLKAKYNVLSTTDNELFLNIYNSTKSFKFLKDIDGYYAAALYDNQKKQLYLITDRYGFKPFYWGLINDNLVWSSELKGFLGHKDFKCVIDRIAVEEFFDFGHQLENRTWFESIELVPPASVIAFDIDKAQVTIENYWSWNDIKFINESIDEAEIADEIGRLFKQSVEHRVNKNERVGISLSGGLDSRAILAATPETHTPLHTLTFGKKDCDDIIIAKKVSKIKGAHHHVLDLNSKDWLNLRINGVWGSDGSISLLHMHGSEFCDKYKSYMDFSLNGFAGDLVCGGSYLNSNNFEKKITHDIIRKKTNCNKDSFVFNDWYRINKTDPYFVNNRVRRFTNSGLIIVSKYVENKIPFFDNDLVEFIYAMPDRARYKSNIYNKMLLRTFPEYFRTIPWQSTGAPISCPDYLVKLVSFKKKLFRRLKREAGRFGFKERNPVDYTDYPEWIRQEPARGLFSEILLNKSSLYPEYIDSKMVHGHLHDHMTHKSNHHNELCLYLTFEVWLQQIFNNRFRQ
ncbi:hypothetical protein DSLASN_02980 [Desulfoluna limicola]|uniref:asparagine synthase (glutamine-hydrolyzing) n=1 Tax=Desulfoluna limicola TaxID=2810562 RepID=A0ABM7PAL2_9BACT|nr:asparagine synthase-related protein [Desulfoluna limicola]BCS94666.1 hypothetical protein DSLASN_02980 [Desulfoluna limicola]